MLYIVCDESVPIGSVNRNQTQITISNCCRFNWAATTVVKLSMVMGVGTLVRVLVIYDVPGELTLYRLYLSLSLYLSVCVSLASAKVKAS